MSSDLEKVIVKFCLQASCEKEKVKDPFCYIARPRYTEAVAIMSLRQHQFNTEASRFSDLL